MHQTVSHKMKKLICIMLLVSSLVVIVKAASTDDSILEPSDDQYLELRAVSVNDISGQDKQVIMELWGNNIDFKRF